MTAPVGDRVGSISWHGAFRGVRDDGRPIESRRLNPKIEGLAPLPRPLVGDFEGGTWSSGQVDRRLDVGGGERARHGGRTAPGQYQRHISAGDQQDQSGYQRWHLAAGGYSGQLDACHAIGSWCSALLAEFPTRNKLHAASTANVCHCGFRDWGNQTLWMRYRRSSTSSLPTSVSMVSC